MVAELDERTFLDACRIDPGTFIGFVLDLDQAEIHDRAQDFMSDHDDCYIELHRGIGKTTQVSAGRAVYEIGRNPDIRIKIVQQNDMEAKKTVAYAKHLIETDRYRKVFPHIQPDPELWGSEQFSVRRNKFFRDATMEAKGIFGRAGGRADILIPDDICDLRNAIQQPALREQVKEAWSTNWLPMLDMSAERAPRTWKVGTCYHVSDITADWRAYHAEHGSLLRVPVVDFRSPWGEVFTPEVLRTRREIMGPVAYGRAFELNPISSDVLVFEARWLDDSLYEGEGEGEHIAMIDWAFTEKRMASGKDPDYSVCIIARKTPNGTVYVRDLIRERMQFPDFMRRVIAACERYKVRYAGAEANGPQKGLVQQANQNAPFPVRPINRKLDKVVRASNVQAQVEMGRFRLAGERDGSGVLRVAKRLQPLYDEMTTFPAGDHDDTVDAAIDLMDARPATSGVSRPVEPTRVYSAASPRLDRIYPR